jgi:erythromycin esterase-like protein
MLNKPSFLIDVEHAITINSSAKSFFTQKIRRRSIGGAFMTLGEKYYYLDQSIYSSFDGLIYIGNTTPTQAM